MDEYYPLGKEILGGFFMKIVTILGARPQFIKSASVSRAIQKSRCIDEIVIHTGQHYDKNMNTVFFDELGLVRPKYELHIGSGSHAEQTGRMLIEIEKVLVKEKPNYTLIYGDTNSTIAGALASVKLHIPIIHVEAGLRSYNRKMPEEINRIVSDQISDILFTPSDSATQNLLKEGIDPIKIHNVGDVMFDNVLLFSEIAHNQSRICEKLGLKEKNFILATIHRAENVDNDEKISNILLSLNRISEKLPVVFPIHPRTKAAIQRLGKLDLNFNENFKFIDPVGYLDMLQLEKNAWKIITDSGGVQKEAYFLKTFCLTLRTETEWTELVDAGVNQLIDPTSLDMILDLTFQPTAIFPKDQYLYGDGKTSIKIVEIIESL